MKTNFSHFLNKQRLSSIIILAGLLTGVCEFTQAAETPLPEPTVDQSADFRTPNFGSDRTVELLGDMLLKSGDVNERTQAAANLGQTNNMNAVKFLAKGFADKKPQVRESVVIAAAALAQQTPEYMHATSAEYKQAVDIIKKAFSDPAQNVKLAAISADELIDLHTINFHNSLTAEMIFNSKLDKPLPEPVNALVVVAEGNNPILAIAALNVLSKQHRRIKDEAVVKHLESNNLSLQIAAAENAVCINFVNLPIKPINPNYKPSQIAVALKKLASSSNDALAATAIEALATRFDKTVPNILDNAAKSPSPLLRRASVNGYAKYYEYKFRSRPETQIESGKISIPEATRVNFYDKIPAFLDDPSPLVKLAAVQAIQTASQNGAMFHQTQKLIDIAFAAPDTQLHKAAITAAIATDDGSLVKIAADAYKKMMPEYLAIKNPAGSILERNLSSVCKIIAEKKSGAVFDEMLADIEKLQLDSVIIGDIADAFGNIGNKSAADVLEKMLKKCQAAGAKYLIAMASMSTPPAFSEPVTVKIINALATLDAKKSAKSIINIALLNVMNMRLTTVAAAVPPAMVKLRDRSNESATDKLLVDMIGDDSYGSLAIFNAAVATGKLRIDTALPGLEKILNEERPGKTTIWAAAWAIGQISGGKYPAQPQPVANQGNWIIKSMESTK